MSKSTVERILLKTLKTVTNSNHVTEIVCKFFCGVLIVDGKYIHVAGHEKKIPMIWALDYVSHDPILHQLVLSENYLAYLSFFLKLKAIHYPLSTIVCDEHEAISQAAKHVYPNVKIQLCTNHIKEGIRRTLNSRSNPVHEHFIKQIECLFRKDDLGQYCRYARNLLKQHYSNDQYRYILQEVNRKHELIIRFLIDKQVPSSSNLIELYNSHLEARLKSIKGFKSFYTAELWLNAYVLNRRLSKFTSCAKKFRHLNGSCSLSQTAMDDAKEISLIKTAR